MVVLSGFTGFFYLVVDTLRLKALAYIDAAIFFPIYKAIGPAIVTLA